MPVSFFVYHITPWRRLFSLISSRRWQVSFLLVPRSAFSMTSVTEFPGDGLIHFQSDQGSAIPPSSQGHHHWRTWCAPPVHVRQTQGAHWTSYSACVMSKRPFWQINLAQSLSGLWIKTLDLLLLLTTSYDMPISICQHQSLFLALMSLPDPLARQGQWDIPMGPSTHHGGQLPWQIPPPDWHT